MAVPDRRLSELEALHVLVYVFFYFACHSESPSSISSMLNQSVCIVPPMNLCSTSQSNGSIAIYATLSMRSPTFRLSTASFRSSSSFEPNVRIGFRTLLSVVSIIQTTTGSPWLGISVTRLTSWTPSSTSLKSESSIIERNLSGSLYIYRRHVLLVDRHRRFTFVQVIDCMSYEIFH